MMTRWLRTILLGGAMVMTPIASAADVLPGADISALPDIERDGAKFFDKDGKPGDEIAILKTAGCQLFRVRLFVDPNPDATKNYGATQGFDYVRGLAKRIKAAGGQFLLDIHYSDTWADPQHQTRPKAWAGLDFDALERRIGEYTAKVMADLQAAGVGPDMVQVGNEITAGMLWPDGKVDYAKTPEARESWRRLSRLLAAGANAVRKAEQGGKRIPIVLHVHGGGRPGLPQGFFDRLKRDGVPIDYDVIGLSFYPTWDDDIDTLRTNMRQLVETHAKGILLAEVAYPWTPVKGIKGGPQTMIWPLSPLGQAGYLRAVRDALNDLPDGRGIGYVWWYPESVRVKGRSIWRDGAEALFDHDGRALPTMDVFSQPRPVVQ